MTSILLLFISLPSPAVTIEISPRIADIRSVANAIASDNRGRVAAREFDESARGVLDEINTALFGKTTDPAVVQTMWRWETLIRTSTLRPDQDQATREKLVDLIGSAIEAARLARREGNELAARNAVVEAVAALGWAAWYITAASPKTSRLRQLNRQYYYAIIIPAGAALVGLGFSNVAGNFIGNASILLGSAALSGFIQDAGDANDDLLVDRFRVPRFITRRQTKRAIEERRREFWFALEHRLSKDPNWLDWSRVRGRVPGVEGIVNDVRDELSELAGTPSPGDVCGSLFTASPIESPFR